MAKRVIKKSLDLEWSIIFIAIISFFSSVFLPLLYAGIIVFISVLLILYKIKIK